ncbi:hypothetical protein ABT218_28675 [Streptomyces sp. NPDC001455]|uniref:hypothetical protein n=1 Tax=Streptomyces sp. NPDC001455 TaxID=3154518 RepID=UPI00331F6BF5
MKTRRTLSAPQKGVLAAAFVPMLATGVAGGVGTYSNISHAYGKGTALGAVAAGEGATAVLALVLLGLTMLGQSSPRVVRLGLWALPAAASVMAAMAGPDAGRTVIYAVTPMGMCVSAEGMAFLARRIVVHTDGRDAEAEARAAAVVQALAYHRAVAANHPDEKEREKADKRSWKLARRVGATDATLAPRLLEVQRDRVADGADAALGAMFAVTPAVTPAVTAVTAPVTPAPAPVTPPLPAGNVQPELEPDRPDHDDAEPQVIPSVPPVEPAPVEDVPEPVTPVTPPVTEGVTPVTESVTDDESDNTDDETATASGGTATLEEIAAVAGVTTPAPGDRLTDEQLDVVLRHLRYSDDPPLSYRQAVTAFRDAGYVGGEQRVRKAWGQLMSHEETDTTEDAAETSESEKDQ